MRAAIYDRFGGPIRVGKVADPVPASGEAILRVRATGICRSDWHGWMGHDSDIQTLPHVPGHEMAGEVHSVGPDVHGWEAGDRVTVPFVAGCGRCEQCRNGNQHICDAQSQPGFTHWGSFAELVRIRYAQDNLVRLPAGIDFVTAAGLGCRFTTAYRATVTQGRTAHGEWVAVYGCGGVGLSAVMIARSVGARVIAVDVNAASLELASKLGAEVTIDSSATDDPAAVIAETTNGGAHVSIDAVGHPAVLWDSVSSLRKGGRHVQVGLLVAGDAASAIPMDRVVSRELEIIGSHGMQAHQFAGLFELITAGRLDPGRLVTHTCTLDEGAATLMTFPDKAHAGVTVIDRFES